MSDLDDPQYELNKRLDEYRQFGTNVMRRAHVEILFDNLLRELKALGLGNTDEARFCEARLAEAMMWAREAINEEKPFERERRRDRDE